MLSREALRKFVEEGIPNPKKCRQDHAGSEDVEIGRLTVNMQHVNLAHDSVNQYICVTKGHIDLALFFLPFMCV